MTRLPEAAALPHFHADYAGSAAEIAAWAAPR